MSSEQREVGKVAVCVDFTPDLRRRIRIAAAVEGVTIRAWLTAAAEARLACTERTKNAKEDDNR